MKIGFDAKRYFENKSGLGSYSRTLINGLIDRFQDIEFFLYTPSIGGVYASDKRLTLTNVNIRVSPYGSSQLWRTKFITKSIESDRLDIYHGLSNELPIGINKTGVKSLVTIHDLLFLAFPQDYRWIDRKIHQLKITHAIKHANHIVAISNKTKQDLLKKFKINESNISTLYQTVSPFYNTDVTAYDYLDSRYVLFVGNYSKRKNLELVIKGLGESDLDLDLVVVVPSTSLPKSLEKLIVSYNLQNRIKMYSGISEGQLKSLYQHATCLLYPSLGEGWGLPLEEAMACGTPTVCINAAPFNEIHSPLKYYLVNGYDHVQLFKIIENIMNNNNNNSNLSNRNAGSFEDLYNIYLKLISTSNKPKR